MKKYISLALALVLAISLAADAAVGIFTRTDCTTITSPVTGQTWCFDATANLLKRWNGSAWETVPTSILTGTVTGTYTLGGTPTLNAPLVFGGSGSLTAPVFSGTYTLGGTPSLPTITGNTTWSAGHPVIPSSTLSALPPAGTAGRLARVTDGVRGIRSDTGVLWAHRNGERILAADFDVDPSRTAAQNATGLAAALTVLSTRGGGSLVLPDSGIVNYDTTLAIPAKVTVEGGSAFSILNYTGTGDGMTLNNLGALTQWRAAIQRVKLTTSTGAVGIRLYNVYENDIIGNIIEGFSNAAIVSDGNDAVFSINIHRNKLLANGRGIRFIGHNAHNQWSIVGNRIQGSSAGAGIQADQFVKSWLIAGNDIEGNLLDEIVFALGGEGISIHGNHFETNAGANNAIRIAGASTSRVAGFSIMANNFFNNLAGATGRAFFSTNTGTGGRRGVLFKGNLISGYGNTTNPAVDFNSQTFTDSDFSDNYYDSSVTTPIGNHSSASSHLWRRFAKIQINLDVANIVVGAEVETTITVTGANHLKAMTVVATPTRNNSGVGLVAAIEAGLSWNAYVSAADTVTLRVRNDTTGAIDPIVRDWVVVVEQYGGQS